jgi:hypothetical protein
MIAADTPPAIVKFRKLFSAFGKNAIVQKLARSPYSVGA